MCQVYPHPNLIATGFGSYKTCDISFLITSFSCVDVSSKICISFYDKTYQVRLHLQLNFELET